jgi:hypothetical protein
MMAKPEPLIVAESTVTGAVPVELNVKDCAVDVSTVTLPKLRLAALTVNCGLAAAVLVPLNATIVVGPVDELLLIVICPLAIPVVVGRNFTCSVVDCMGFSITGKVPPTVAKPAPAIAAEFTFTGAVPVEVNVSDCVVGVSTVTLPKLRLAELTVNSGLAAAVLVPLNATIVVLPIDELLLMVICPLTEPTAVGSNRTWSFTDWVGFSVTGKLSATIVKPVPVIAAEFIVTGTVPVEVRVRDWVVEVSTITLRKLKFPALTANCGLADVVPAPLRATSVLLPVDESLLTVICPLAAPLAAGSNFT